MRTLRVLAISLVAVLGLYSCGSDKNEEKENQTYFVKSITMNVGGESKKYSFEYNNDKLSKITYVDYFGDIDEFTFSYPSATKVNITSVDREDEITLDASNVVSTRTSSESDFSASYSFSDGYLSNETYSAEGYTYSWSNGNMTTMGYTIVNEQGSVLSSSSTAIEYSNVTNNTNMDLYIWLERDGQDFCGFLALNQFIKNVSKNIPSSVKDNDKDSVSIKTTLDDKGRPSKLEYDGAVYTFEYNN